MLCEKCGKNEAVYFYSETINGKKHSVALCGECAPSDISFGSSILSGLFSEHPFASGIRNVNTAKKCGTCGITFYEIRKSGKAGCPDCYESFKNELDPIIKRIHGTAVYKNGDMTEEKDTPAVHKDKEANSEEKSEAAELRRKLALAVKEENYELAATLRDELRELIKKEGE